MWSFFICAIAIALVGDLQQGEREALRGDGLLGDTDVCTDNLLLSWVLTVRGLE
jgi:hypothetical protein